MTVLVEESLDNFFAASMAWIAIFCDGTIIIACGLYGGGLQSFSHCYTEILFEAIQGIRNSNFTDLQFIKRATKNYKLKMFIYFQ